MKNNFILKTLPFFFLILTIGVTNYVHASEVTGNLSSAGVSNTTSTSTSNTGSLTGTVESPAVTTSNSSGGSGGGGGFVIPNLEQPLLNPVGSTGGQGGGVGQVLGASTSAVYIPYVAPRTYSAPRNNIAYTGNDNRVLSFNGMGGEDLSSTTTETLAQTGTPIPAVVATQPGTTLFMGFSMGAWILLFILFVLAIIAYYYFNNENTNTRRRY